jgi:hypothetical protein
VIAHGHAPDVGNRGLFAQAQFEMLKSEVPPPISMTNTCRSPAPP